MVLLAYWMNITTGMIIFITKNKKCYKGKKKKKNLSIGLVVSHNIIKIGVDSPSI